MTDPDLVMELFAAASELSAVDRAAFLARECGGQPELLAKLESLLASEARAEAAGFLSLPALEEIARQTAADPKPDKHIGECFGRYRVIRLLGEGGMGEVYLAEDTELNRKVALKLIKSALRTEELLDRFARERRILAHLNHENIARLLDAGTNPAGIPFLVMEYVDGRPITEHCDATGLAVSPRLELFRVVCAAVQYAHQNVVVHRDLKPGNILVTSAGQVKLLDFGIAKLLDSPVPLDAGNTFLPALTPEYASPEQVRGEITTTATDVYSLGVVLYELLTGSGMYTLKRRTSGEMLKAICEQEPKLPSAAVAPASCVAAIEGGAQKLCRRLRSDLDQIVLKALRKEPEARYPTVEQFSADVARHLEGSPVLARRRTFSYRAAKFVRRHRAVVFAAAAVLLTLLGGIVATTWQARLAITERGAAQKRFEEARKLAHTVLFDYHDAIAALPGSTVLRQRLATDALAYLNQMSKDAGGDVALQLEVATAYLRVGDVQGRPYTPNLGQTEPALASYRKALAILEPIASSTPSIAAGRQLANAYERIGAIHLRQQRLFEALLSQQLALAIRRQLLELNPADSGIRAETANGQLAWGDALQAVCFQGKAVPVCLGLSLAMQRRALDTLQELSHNDPGDLQLRRDLATVHMRVGFRLRDMANFEHDRFNLQQALANEQTAMQIREEIAAADPSNSRDRRSVADQRMLLSNAQASLGDLSSALAGYRESLAMFESLFKADPANAEARRDLAFVHTKLGQALTQAGRFDAALESYSVALVFARQLLLEEPDNGEDRQELAGIYQKTAETAALAAHLPPGRADLLEALKFFGLGRLNLLAADGKQTAHGERPWYREAARDALRRCLDLLRTLGGPNDAGPIVRDTWDAASRDLRRAEAALPQ